MGCTLFFAGFPSWLSGLLWLSPSGPSFWPFLSHFIGSPAIFPVNLPGEVQVSHTSQCCAGFALLAH